MVSANEMISRFGEFVAGTYLGLRPDWELQEKWYLGVFEAMSIYDWFYGHGWYGQDFNGPYYDRGTGPSFRNKLAEDVVRIYYGDGTLPNRAVALNGVPDEWADADLVWERLDSLEPVDRGKLLRISSRQDGLGLFLLIELEGNLVPYFPRHDGITMHITVNDDTEQEYTCRIYHGRFDWVGTLVSTTDPFEYVGFVDVAQDPTNTIFELGIPLHLLDFPSSTLIRVETVTHGTRVNAWLEETHEGELLDQMEAPIEITLNVNS